MTNFTDAQVIQIQLLLGYPILWQSYDPRCYQTIIAADNIPLLATTINALLVKIATIETNIDAYLTSIMATKTEDTETDFAFNVEHLRKQGRILIGRISTMLGCAVREDYFGRNTKIDNVTS